MLIISISAHQYQCSVWLFIEEISGESVKAAYFIGFERYLNDSVLACSILGSNEDCPRVLGCFFHSKFDRDFHVLSVPYFLTLAQGYRLLEWRT